MQVYIIGTLAHTDRISASEDASTVDYTGQIHQFSEIGPGGTGTTLRPWGCFTAANAAQWLTPSGNVVPTTPGGFTKATGSELYQATVPNFATFLVRGPDYNSPDGEYCCVITAIPDQRRCVTLSQLC